VGVGIVTVALTVVIVVFELGPDGGVVVIVVDVIESFIASAIAVAISLTMLISFCERLFSQCSAPVSVRLLSGSMVVVAKFQSPTIL